MRNICIFVFSFILGYTDSQVVDIDELYSLLQDRYQARSETGQPKTASPNPDEKIDVEGLTQRLDLLENEISLIKKAQQLEADKTEPDSIQSQVMILRRAFKAEKTVARKLKSQMISLNQQVEISLENLIMQIKEIMAKQSTHEEIIEANKASMNISHENLEIQLKALTEKQTSQEEVIQANKASVDISHENLEAQIKALTDKQEEIININKASVRKLKSQMNALTEKQEEIIKANKASVDISHGNLEIQLKALTEKQTTQEEIIKANKASVAQLSNPPKVHFYANVIGNRKLSAGSKFVFNKVISQYGGGYNNADGVFTVPVTGVYLISVVLANQNPTTTTWIIGLLKVDSKTKANILSENYHASQYDQGSNIAILKLWKGQKVWVEMYQHSNRVVRSGYSTLAAVLLHT